ncbi:hypothetical protein F2Q69_00003782 [Brassica cretica]|uniref:Uncharacterized protein n=1 Tax=Brassica cretica TaxID=69181 RepID=A0A8S9P0N8_BRACR|nr:hypothetical protein F2Q69_00003782 [Brassica cretica]
MQSQQGLLGLGLKVEENKSFDFSLDCTKRFKTRSTSFALLWRRSRRRNPPALMAKKKNSKKPPTKPYPTGSGSSHSVLKQSTPEIPSAVNSEIQTKQADLGLSSASSGPTSPSEPSMPASVTIAASTPKLTETLTSATVASALQASVPEQTVDPSTSTQLGLIEKRQSQKQIFRRKEVEAPAITPHLAAPIDSPQDAVVENPSLSITENRLPASQTIKEGQPQLKLTFAEISASPARKSDLNSQISLPIHSPIPIISTYTAVTDTPSSLTVAFDYDVSKGGFFNSRISI